MDFKVSLHILHTSTISDRFCKYFLRSMDCLFIVLTESFTEQKLLILIKYNLSKKILKNAMRAINGEEKARVCCDILCFVKRGTTVQQQYTA